MDCHAESVDVKGDAIHNVLSADFASQISHFAESADDWAADDELPVPAGNLRECTIFRVVVCPHGHFQIDWTI